MICFESDVFDAIVQDHLLYDPKIEIHPAHLANGLFRAVCGSYTNDNEQHKVLFPKEYPGSTALNILFFENTEHAPVREMLHTLLNADRRMFRSVNTSSYTLTHVSHITSDNHDRGTGEWLRAILSLAGEGETTALHLLQTALNEPDRRRSDELSVLTIPLVEEKNRGSKPIKPKLDDTNLHGSLQTQADGTFLNPLISAIRKGFDTLAAHDERMIPYGRKLDALQRIVRWGCFAVYLHLATIGFEREEPMKRVPLVFCVANAHTTPTLHHASMQSYQWLKRSIDEFFRQRTLALVEEWATNERHGKWETPEQVRSHIEKMRWKKSKGGPEQTQEKQEQHTPRCLRFYDAYCNDTENNQTPRSACAHALTDMLDSVFSATPTTVARTLGVQIGLLSTTHRQKQKIYNPSPDILELLVRASIPPGETWTINRLAAYWADTYGILVGTLGDENSRLHKWNISAVNGTELKRNGDELAQLLEYIGYARCYADGVVLVSVKE